MSRQLTVGNSPDRFGKKPGGGSPLKKKITGSISSRSKSVITHRIIARAIHPEWPVEILSYEVGNTQNGWSDGYTYNIRKHINASADDAPEELQADRIPILTEIGLRAYFYQRHSYERNDFRAGAGKGFPMLWLVRVVPDELPSTEATRRDGMEQLKLFLTNVRYTKYPPAAIQCIDETDLQTPLDRLLRDNDVVEFVSFIFDEDTLNNEFAINFPDHAALVFGGPSYPEIAITKLGYNNRGLAPGFNIGAQASNLELYEAPDPPSKKPKHVEVAQMECGSERADDTGSEVAEQERSDPGSKPPAESDASNQKKHAKKGKK